jgi:hypothetical protein
MALNNTNLPKKHPTVPIQSTVEKVKGHNTLTIYKMEKSPYYYVRIFENGKVLRKSTKTEDRRGAIKFAEEYFLELKGKQINKLPLTQKSGFEVCAYGLLKENKTRVLRKEIVESKIKHDEARLKKDILPYFKHYQVADIDYKVISGYIDHLIDSRDGVEVSGSTLKIHLSHIKTILGYAHRMNVIHAMPAFPKIKTVDTARTWFDKAEYSKLHNTARTHIGDKFEIKAKSGVVIRRMILTSELYELILFMANTFIRPTDLRVLKHKHIAVVKGSEVFLRLTHPPTKKHNYPIVSMPKAIEVYGEILKRQKEEGFGDGEDYVFQPQHKINRDYAIQQLHRQFEYVLRLAGLKVNGAGEKRTLYSLRHTSIMFRLIEAQDLDLLTLARNARTSVEMIERFYAKHLTGEMNVRKIQSNRSVSKTMRNEEIKDRLMKN